MTPRTIIGFDRRVTLYMDNFQFSVQTIEGLARHDCDPPYPATISAELWPRPKDINNIERRSRNEFGLLFFPEESEFPSVLVAFSVDQSALDDWLRPPYFMPFPEIYLFPEMGWRSLGYDIVNNGLHWSCIYDLRLLTSAMCQLVGDGERLLNRHGLIDSIEVAEELKLQLDKFGPPVDSPFQVVKVLAKISPRATPETKPTTLPPPPTGAAAA